MTSLSEQVDALAVAIALDTGRPAGQVRRRLARAVNVIVCPDAENPDDDPELGDEQ